MGYPSDDLTFNQFARTNSDRAKAWPGERGVPWTGADWGNAMGGECGEAQNVIKKLRRVETGVRGNVDPPLPELVEKLGDELADTITYAFLVADHYGINVAEALCRKFNKISEREGVEHRVYPS